MSLGSLVFKIHWSLATISSNSAENEVILWISSLLLNFNSFIVKFPENLINELLMSLLVGLKNGQISSTPRSTVITYHGVYS